jgi:hypothetical protein
MRETGIEIAIFLHEVSPTLRRIGEHGGPHTVYYLDSAA